MEAFAGRIVLLWGWKRFAVAFLAGALSAVALPPYQIPFVLFITLPVLVWLIDGAIGASKRRKLRTLLPAFAVGWWFGFGFFLATLYWLSFAFLVEPDLFAWMIPFVIVIAPGLLAIYFGVAAALARLFWSDGAMRIVTFALFFALAEWARGHFFSGFPWNLLGYALTSDIYLMQLSSVFDIYGLTFLTFLLFASPAVLSSANPRWALPMVSVLLLVCAYGFGYSRLSAQETTHVPGIGFRLVQLNVPQIEKWVPENRDRIFQSYLDFSDLEKTPSKQSDNPITHIIWPEAAPPFFLTREPWALNALSEILPDDARLVTGSNRIEIINSQEEATVHNSVFSVTGQGSIESIYDKIRLVPFGEFVPFESILERFGVTRIVPIPGSFAKGRKSGPIVSGAAPLFRPLICYEIIYSGDVTGDGERPGWLLNVTNEAWFGVGDASLQLMHMARVRAVEEGIPVVRSANTGPSAVIDAFGRIDAQFASGGEGVLDVGLPEAILPPFASLCGIYVYYFLIGLAFIGTFSVRLIRKDT